MKFLPAGYNTKTLESGVKNKWRWEWLNEVDSRGGKWGEWLRKPEASGVAFCSVCNKSINYKSNGKKAMRLHAEDAAHMKNAIVVKTNQVLPGSSKAKPGTESMADRVANVRALTAVFLAENCLPFNIAEKLLAFANRVSQDKPALEKTTISKSSVTYITTHGVAKSIKDELKLKVKDKMVSLTIDEATNNCNDKILNVIIQYYDDDEERVELRHLGSRKQNLATAKNILHSIESILGDYEIEWWQVTSVLMDNCSTMRGVRGGVETLIREKNPNLLDISGDTVHMVNNAAKVLLNNVDSGIRDFCSDLYYDVEESPKVKEIFHEVQALLNITTQKHLIRPISSRFLQMLDVTNRVIDMWDPLTIYFYSFLTDEEKRQYRPMMTQIYMDHNVSDEAQAAVTLIQMSQEQQQKSSSSHDRKDRILDSLFENRRETSVKLNLFRGLLSHFQGYVKVFQSESPLIHTLHGRMVDVVQKFLGMFVRPECVPDGVSKLKKVDVEDKSIQKVDKDLGVGKFAYAELNKARVDKTCRHWVSSLYNGLRTGYVMAAKKLMQLPLANKTIRYLSVLGPEFVGHSQTEASLKKLCAMMPAGFTEEEQGSLSMEASRYNVDPQVKILSDSYKEEDNVDVGYWSKVFALKDFTEQRYPMLHKLVSPALTVFSGPLIESTFNIMDDIVEKDRTRMTVMNYEAVAIIKTYLRKRRVRSTDLKVSAGMKKACISAYATYKTYLKNRKEDEEKKIEEKLRTSVQSLKLLKAKRLAKLVKLKKKIVGTAKESRKRKNSNNSDRKWKRIKVSV